MFVECPGGGIDFGYLPDETAKAIRRQAGPIRLLESDLRHIEERHGDQIRHAGYEDVPSFVQSVCTESNTIYRGKHGGGALVLIVRDPGSERPNKTAIIKLQPDTDPGKGGTDFYAVKTAMLTKERYYRKEIPLLQRDAPITRSLERTPFRARPEADGKTLEDGTGVVKSAARYPPSSAPGAPFNTPAQEKHAMAAELDHLFSYGPLDVVATNDDQARGLHVIHEDAQMSAFIPSDDPLHKEVRSLIEKNPHSRGFVANQIQARLEREGRWAGPALDEEGVSFGPSQEVVQELVAENPAREIDPNVEQEATIPETRQRIDDSVQRVPSSDVDAGQQQPEQTETSPKGVAEPSTEEDLTKDWPGNPAKEAQAPEQKAPESEPVRTFPKKSPPEILLADAKRGKALVLDHGDKVSVTNRAMLGIGREAEDRRNKSVEVALKAAKERFGEPVRFSGSRAFEEKTIEMAVRLGIALEPATEHGKRAYEQALEAKNALGPSQNRAPSKQKVVEKGIGL
jgi:hypothetical protein